MILSEEQEQIRDMLRDFSREQLAPKAAEWDRTCHFPREELRALGELGVCGMVVPEEWGGAGLDYVSLALALEEIAAGDGAVSTIISVQNSVVCGPINAFGTDEQKAQYLKKLASGEWLAGFAYRTDINPLVFLLSATMAAAIAFITLALQSFKTARSNPIQALRYE